MKTAEDVIARLRSLYRKQLQAVHHDISTETELVSATYWSDNVDIVISIPAELLVMQAALNYASNHPFVNALKTSRAALQDYYAEVQPKDISDLYRLDCRDRLGCNLPAWEIPWYGRQIRTPPPGEAGLPRLDGVSFYGPVSERKLEAEYLRLVSVMESIDQFGFNPEKYGYPEGYVLQHDDRARFFIRGGKHRVAALVALGKEKIPVKFRSTFPRLISKSNRRYFPLVAEKMMDESVAEEILSAYIHA